MGLGLDWTGLILVRPNLEFWDRTVVQSPKKLGPDRRVVQSIFSRPDWLQSPKKLGLDCVAVLSQFLRLNGPSLGEKDQTRLYAMVAEVGIVIQSDLEPMSVTPRCYS